MTTPHLRPLATALALGALLLLAACGRQSQAPTATGLVSGTATAFGDAVPLAIAFAMIDAAELEYAMPKASSFVEVGEDGLFLGPLAPIAEDGSFELVLPDPDDVPEATLAPADGFLAFPGLGSECTLTASDSDARVSALMLGEAIIPGFVAFTIYGAELTIVSDAPLDWGAGTEEELFGDASIITWIYADRPVDVGASAGCADEGVVVDLALRAGWNQIGLSFDFENDIVTLGNDDSDEVVVQVLNPS